MSWRAALLWLGHALTRAGEELQTLALKGASIVPVKPMPAPAAQSAVQSDCGVDRPDIPLPDLDTIERARAQMAFHDMNRLKLCRGSAKGCTHGNPHGCPNCYIVPWHDKRSSAEILAAIERGDA